MFDAFNKILLKFDSATDLSNDGDACGYQVLRNTNPNLKLEPWFDFIVGINGERIINSDVRYIVNEIQKYAGTSIQLTVWNAKGQLHRNVHIPVPQHTPKLSISVQWNQLATANEVWHILTVAPNSPAEAAGILPYSDYVIGSPEASLKGESGLSEIVSHFIDKPLQLHIYNHEYDIVRPVSITPSRNWGGEGCLGCVLGYGALHRIPSALEEPPPAPGEIFFRANETVETSLNKVFRTDESITASCHPYGFT